MYILDSSKTTIHDAEAYARFKITPKPDAVLVVAFQNCETPAVTIGKYADEQEAKEALDGLFYALISGSSSFEMPDSRMFHEEERKHDARIKRKGGS